MKISAYLLIFAGIALVGISFAWPVLFPPESRWTQEQAEEHSKAGTHFHRIALGGHSHAKGRPRSNGQGAKASEGELAAARARWEASKAALTAAQTQGHNTAGWFRYSGATVALIGVAGLVLDKRRATNSAAKPDPFVLLDV
jgi:hypothetical protein